MKRTPIIAIAIVILATGGGIFYYQKFIKAPQTFFRIDYSKQYPETISDKGVFEKQKTGADFSIYYHLKDAADANKSLAILEQAGAGLYGKYLGLTPKNIHIYLTDTADEYARIANFPGGSENTKVGAGSAPDGNIYLFKPFGDPSVKTDSIIIHEGTHAVIYQFLGREGMGNLPGFLNEGLAHFMEYTFEYGEGFQPLKQMNPDLWFKIIKTGNPAPMALDELARNCEGYIADGEKDALCRSQGAFVVWYIIKNYGRDAWANFLAYIKEGRGWQKSLEMISGKNFNQLNQDIFDALKLPVN